MDAIVINCTVPDKRVAKEIAKHLIKYRLAACVSAVDKVESTFSWDGEIAKEKEVLLIIKTLRVNFERIKEVISDLHPYQVPEIIALPIVDCSKEYLQWLVHETQH
jgi:periplasmic divalent cation tolerance protein